MTLCRTPTCLCACLVAPPRRPRRLLVEESREDGSIDRVLVEDSAPVR